MPLVIEDGTSKDNAESFVTVTELNAFATARGVVLPAEEPAVEILLRKAADFLRYQSFSGRKTSRTQALPFPRSGVIIDDEAIPDDEIPVDIKNAQCQAAIDASTQDLLPTVSGRDIIKEEIDVIKTEYAAEGKGSKDTVFTKTLVWLTPWLSGAGELGGINATVSR
jgi:hypothetical protein